MDGLSTLGGHHVASQKGFPPAAHRRRTPVTDPTRPVAGRARRPGHPGQDPPGRRPRRGLPPRHPPVGRSSVNAVSHLVARFNRDGLAALSPRHGGGQPRHSGHAARQRVLREARREPTPEAHGTAAWSLSTLRRTLRSASDGLPKLANSTIWQILHASRRASRTSTSATARPRSSRCSIRPTDGSRSRG